MILMQQSSPRPRRLRAAFIGFGLDSGDDEQRLTRGDQTLIFGGSAETHAELRETALKMEQELSRRGQDLAELDPIALAELAATIDSPELHEIAMRLQQGLEQQGRAFEDLTAEELTELSAILER
jgi:HPt (histidine-containing phosphotransfer) domain-containing protein